MIILLNTQLKYIGTPRLIFSQTDTDWSQIIVILIQVNIMLYTDFAKKIENMCVTCRKYTDIPTLLHQNKHKIFILQIGPL